MSRNIEQVNELLQNKLAYLIAKEIPLEEGLITIAYVNCSPNLRSAKIGVSILPIRKKDQVLKRLRQSSSHFSHILRKETKLRQIPKFIWIIDYTEEEAGKIEKFLEEIKDKN